MFSQFRQTVESLTPVPRHSSDSNPPDDHREQISRSNSLDSRLSSTLSSTQLAESALVNLRKSITNQRSGSVGQTSKPSGPPENRTKSRLEDRLRAATSNALASHVNTSPSVPALPTTTQSLSPLSIPLPDSPTNSSELEPVDSPSATLVQVPNLSGLASIHSEPVDETSTTLQDEMHSPVSALVTHTLDNSTAPESTAPSGSAAIDELQARLRQVEQRFVDVSASFRKLQAEKTAADLVLQEFPPLKSFEDPSALRKYLENMAQTTETFQDEVKRLQGKLELQEDRIDELNRAQRSESTSQLDQIEKLRTQLLEAEALITAGQKADARAAESALARQAEVNSLQKDLERAESLAKEEEEKRVKAISLLKTVRQKLVKAEKDKEDALKELSGLKEKDWGEKERQEAEKARMRSELETANLAKERAIADSRARFDKDLANVKDRYEKETTVIKGQFELQFVTAQSAHDHEVASKLAHISSLEQSLNNARKDKNVFFDSLQLRQAELESAQSHLESLQSQNTELQYQLRELDDRCILLQEDLAEAQKEQEAHIQQPLPSADEVARLLSTNETKYEAKISALKKNLDQLEKERNVNEAEWSRKLRDKLVEVDELKMAIGSTAGIHEQHEEVVSQLKANMAKLEGERRVLQEQVSELRKINLEVKESEKTWKPRELEFNEKIKALERQFDESRQQETKLRLANKTLRDELRKVQSSAALLERQRNPGYWSPRGPENSQAESQPSVTSPIPRVGSPVVAVPSPDDEVNLEYLRNVVLQFLENKEMRPNLVKVLSIILRFTPQETRRLVAKI